MNSARGEIEIALGDDLYKIKASAQAMAEIEGALGKPLGRWIEDLGQGSISVTAQCIIRMMTPKVNIQRAYALIEEHSIEAFGEPIVRALVASGVVKTEKTVENPPKATA